jgi:uncharacterized protein
LGTVRSERVYDLRDPNGRSDRFYADVATFSDRVRAEIEGRASTALDGYSGYVWKTSLEGPRSRGELAMELLTLGMAVRVYGKAAADTPGWVVDLARRLFRLRRKSARLKPVVDFVRAGLFQLFLSKRVRAGYRSASGDGRDGDQAEGSDKLGSLPRLTEWLRATGEWEHESQRIANWESYLGTLPRAEAEGWVATSVGLFDWFECEAHEALGGYTQGVSRFLQTDYARRWMREDQLFCGRQAVEYHLGMVAAEVMNTGLRDGFEKTSRRVVLVPTCMRGTRASSCRARTRGVDITCTGCDPDCTVNRITSRMGREGIPVYMVPHASGFSRWLERWQRDKDVGVIAVACMLNILPGGYEMRAREIASQCVPLDYPGCRKHWSREGLATGVNAEQLVQIATVSRS